jgi:hypothetical protein
VQTSISPESERQYQQRLPQEKIIDTHQKITFEPQTNFRIPELIFASLILVAFTSFALVNIETSKKINLLSPLPNPPTQVSGAKTTIPTEVTPIPNANNPYSDEVPETATGSAELENQDQNESESLF